MRYLSPGLVLMGALTLQAPVAHAVPITFNATLTQANEVPPTGSPATGNATVILDPALNTLQVHVTFSGLESPPLRRTFIAAWLLLSCQASTSGSQPRSLRLRGSLWE